jgi:apolipoprotein N-acyltransferase
MAKKKAADNISDESKLVPFGYVPGSDIKEFLIQFGFNEENHTVEEFIKSHFNID